MDNKTNDKETVAFTMEMMSQLINQLNAVTTYFELIEVQIKKLQARMEDVEKRK